MITAISWVPKGAMKTLPEVADPLLREDIEDILRKRIMERNGDDDSEEDEIMEVDPLRNDDEVAKALSAADTLVKKSKKASSDAPLEDLADGLKELDMDEYDEEDEDVDLFGTGTSSIYYPSNEVDPYLLKDKDDDDSEELEDREINPIDSVIVCGRTDEDYNYLEVYVFQEDLGDGDTNLYVHHEIVLSDFPLCTEWLDCPLKGGNKGNFIAVGSMDPAIEIWDLDIIDAVEPCLVLGGQEEVKKKKKKGKKASIKYKEGSHTDSVMSLAWNKEFRNILASGSGDSHIKIWDVATGKCNITMEHHKDKVQAITWNPCKPNILLSGSFDKSIVMRDGKAPSHSGYKWLVASKAEVECLAWNPHEEHSFVVSLSDGTVKGFDARDAVSNPSSESTPTFTIDAHSKAVCQVSYSPTAKDLLVTGSEDKTVKLWDLKDNQPSCVASRSPKLGALFSVSFSEDSPFLLALGGSKGKLEIWDVLSDASVSQRFGKHRA
ncbi:hypothetical protein SAY86_004200 [Trapa natans]|uniref:Anaphase-promoting complex subunit 4-like WD40 domain-containing protein n=1 Tax=Trapa natans TaxID=22666 RepID=A0AAN7N659_TRANT|nr:hypothetical protein SAY86_004200 [Trapa natans]